MNRRFFFCALIGVLCSSTAANGFNHVRTEQRTMSATPAPIGDGSGRLCLTLKNGGAAATASLFCGPCDEAVTEYYELTPAESYTWGSNSKESFSAQTAMCCAAASGTQLLYISEEGEMPPWTPTPTPTSTPTP